MKRIKISAAFLAALMLVSCSNAKVDETVADITDATEQTISDKVEIKLETPEKEMQQVAYWFDTNLNFSRDASDDYFVDMRQVSMAAYYEALENNEDLAAFDAYSRFLVGEYLDEEESPDPQYIGDCEYVSLQEHVFDETNDIKRAIPHIDLGTEDAEKVNEEILDHMRFFALYRNYDFPDFSLKHVEREDGSKTVIWYYHDYDRNSICVYNFDKDGNLMTNEEVLESAGYNADEFLKKAEESIKRDTQNASVYSAIWGGIDPSWVMRAFHGTRIRDQQLYINEDGAVVFILDLESGVNFGDFPYAIENDIQLSNKIDHTSDISVYERFFRDYQLIVDYMDTGLNTYRYFEEGVVDMDSIDVNTVPEDLHNSIPERVNIDVQMISMTARENMNYLIHLKTLCREDGNYKYEFYHNGEVIQSGTVTMTADPYYEYVEFEYTPEEDGDYLVVVYDKDSDDKVFAGSWFRVDVESIKKWRGES